MPASLITLLCTGAVTIAENSRALAAEHGAIDEPQHRGRVAQFNLARDRRHGQGLVQHREFSGRARGRLTRAA